MSEDKKNEEMFKPEGISKTERAALLAQRMQSRDLNDIKKMHERIARPKWFPNEGIMNAAMQEHTDNEFECVEPILRLDNSPASLFLSPESKKALGLQRLKRLYQKIAAQQLPTQKEFQSLSLFETVEHFNDLNLKPPHVLSALPHSDYHEKPKFLEETKSHASKMEIDEDRKGNVEDKKGKEVEEKFKISFSFPRTPQEGAYEPKGINDTFLPERCNIYRSLYKNQSKFRHKQGKRICFVLYMIDIEEFMNMIGNDTESNIDMKDKAAKIEIVAMLKVQQVFHKWVYKYLSTKVQDLKKSLHDKAAFEKVLLGKKIDETDTNKSKQGKSSTQKALPVIICSSSIGDPLELDYPIKNPAENLMCCLCKQIGERKVYC